MKTALPAALLALAVGVVAGWFARDRRAASPEPTPAAPPPVIAPGAGEDLKRLELALKESTDKDAELARQKQRIKDLEAKLPKEKKAEKKTPKTPEEIAARVEEIRAEIATLVEKKDGAELIKRMHELASMGEAGYMLAIEISGILSEDVESGKLSLGISQNEFYMSFGGPMVPVMVWGIEQGDKVPAGFRIGATYGLPWQKDVDSGRLFLKALQSEKDPAVARALAENMAGVIKPEMAADLAAAAAANAENPAVLGSIMQSLSNIQTDEAVRFLDDMARSQNPALASEAELALIAVRPPAAGLLITYTAPNSQAEVAGIRRGDIIVSYNGASIKDLDQLRAEIGKTSGDNVVTVMVNRKGELVPLQIKGQKIGINGKSVAPK